MSSQDNTNSTSTPFNSADNAKWVFVAIGVLTFLAGASAQFQTLFGEHTAQIIGAVLVLVNGSLSVVGMVISGQSGQLNAVRAMPGVSSITVNSQANPALAAMAVDPGYSKIKPEPGANQVVASIAQQG